MQTDFNEHALTCGVNLTGKVAIPVEVSAGRLVMVDIIHPVSREIMIHAGTTMDVQLIDVCLSHGVDYLVVYKGRHTPLN